MYFVFVVLRRLRCLLAKAFSSDELLLPPDLSHHDYPASYSDMALIDAITPDQPESSIERDNKLLSFCPLEYNYQLLDYSLRRTSVTLTAQLHGMFFMAEAPSAVDPSAEPAELTCYRRNLFQITGSITLPRGLRYFLTNDGNRISIVGQELSISATESVEKHPVKLISVPWKTSAPTGTVVTEEKTEKEPTSIPLDIMSNQDMDAAYATFPIAWKRLQFRIATANNGRRKELQQHFVVRLRVMATLSTGLKVCICETKSGAIIVRGRSPRNFQQKKDFPVGGSASNGRKMQPLPSSRVNATAEPSSLKPETSTEQAFTSFNFDQPDIQTPKHFSDWKKAANSVPSPSGTRVTRRSSSSVSKSPPSTPVVLSLKSEESGTRSRSNKIARTSANSFPYKSPSLSNSATFFTQSPGTFQNGLDTADLLYEYFPLGLDDWMPPVNAVYRPHVVHHVNVAGTTAGGNRPGFAGRSKRYFSEDQS